jgi:hypothetical protein
VIRIHDESKKLPNGSVIYKNRWTPIPGGPPAKSGAVRLTVNDGYWLLEAAAGGKRTKARYYVFTDPGGNIPSFIANAANSKAIPDLFAAVRKAAKRSKYRKARPVLPGGSPAAINAPAAPTKVP